MLFLKKAKVYNTSVINNFFKKTKIIATLGPASSSKEEILNLILAGANFFRLNLSHGKIEEHLEKIKIIKDLRKERDFPIGIIVDLQGPKIRLGNLKTNILLKENEELELFFGKNQIDNRLPVTFNFFKNLSLNENIYINDGAVKIKVLKINEESIICKVIIGGEIASEKGINIPNLDSQIFSLTEKDKNDLQSIVKENVDFIALSFIKTPNDVLELKNILKNENSDIKIIAKIETKLAVKNLEKIIKIADAVMIARGDLAIEISQEEVPLIQQRIIKICQEENKPVIVATQMLESMRENPTPTRAETSDIATAVINKVDCVMLSAETATGNYPLECVKLMNKIIITVNKNENKNENIYEHLTLTDNQTLAVCNSAVLLARELNAKAIIILSTTGETLRKISFNKPQMITIGVTPNFSVFNKVNLLWGIIPFLKEIDNNMKVLSEMINKLLEKNIIVLKDKIILVTGKYPGVSGETNNINVITAEEYCKK